MNDIWSGDGVAWQVNDMRLQRYEDFFTQPNNGTKKVAVQYVLGKIVLTCLLFLGKDSNALTYTSKRYKRYKQRAERVARSALHFLE